VKTPKSIKPLPFPFYFWPVAAIALSGLVDSVYLSVSHYRVHTDMGYHSFCAVSKAINCDTVSQSRFSIFLNVPVPVWGIFGYLFFMVLLVFVSKTATQEKSRLWPTLFMVALCFSLYSIVLALISTFYIRSYCIMCIASYAVNLLLLFYCWLIHRRFSRLSLMAGLKEDFLFILKNRIKSAVLIGGFLALFVMLGVFFPAYWEMSPPIVNRDIPSGITADGHPWIGGEDPILTITEFTDYQCFQCTKMHFYLRELVEDNPEKIRLVHRHFPMDHAYNPLVKEPLHVGSGKMALYSLYAAERGKFWLFNDMLFDVDTSKGHFNLRGMAKNAGFDVYDLSRAVKDPGLQRKLLIDIRDGLRLGVTGTPTYIIDGEVYVGNIPPEKIASVSKE